jgi:hypothetical protein
VLAAQVAGSHTGVGLFELMTNPVSSTKIPALRADSKAVCEPNSQIHILTLALHNSSYVTTGTPPALIAYGAMGKEKAGWLSATILEPGQIACSVVDYQKVM